MFKPIVRMCCILAFGSASAFGQRVFVAGAVSPQAPPTPALGDTFTIEAKGGDTLTLEVWVENLPVGTKLRRWQATMPCSATGGDFGSIDFTSGPVVDTTDTDYVFWNLAETFTLSFSGKCPAEPPFAGKGVSIANSVTVTNPKYMVTFTYTVSTDAQGTFQITPPCVPSDLCTQDQTFLLDPNLNTFSNLVSAPITINVPTGRCCIDLGCSQDCQAGVTEFACSGPGGLGGKFKPGLTCPCPECSTGLHCDDGSACTTDRCQSGVCSNPLDAVYGDIIPCGGDGVVDIDDVLSILSAFNGVFNCDLCESGVQCIGGAAARGSSASGASTGAVGALTLVPAQNPGRAGGLLDMDVFAEDVVDLRGYQVTVEVGGGTSGRLALDSVFVDRKRADYVFGGEESFSLIRDARMVGVLVAGGVSAEGSVYLGTYRFRASADASGTFDVNVRTGKETLLRDSTAGPIQLNPVSPVTITIP